jgi:hypothetical protein
MSQKGQFSVERLRLNSLLASGGYLFGYILVTFCIALYPLVTVLVTKWYQRFDDTDSTPYLHIKFTKRRHDRQGTVEKAWLSKSPIKKWSRFLRSI